MSKPSEQKAKTMPGGSDKSSVVPCNDKSTKAGQKKSGQPPSKRAYSEVSNSSTEEIGFIHQQLDSMSENLTELREDLKTLLKKDDIEKLITSTITNIMEKMEQKMN